MTEKNETDQTEQTTETEQISSPQSEAEEDFEEVNFSELTDFVEGGVEETPPVEVASEEQETPVEETPPEETAEAEQQSESEEVQEEETPTEPEVKAEETPAEEPQQVEETPVAEEVKVPTREELDGMYQEHRDQTLPVFEKMFQLSEEEANALDEQPSKVLPQLAARVMYDTMLSTYNAVVAAMPGMVGRFTEASESARSAEKTFYDKWPGLREKPEYGSAVETAIKAYRSANPRAKLDDVIQNAGLMASIQLGLDPKKAGGEEPPREETVTSIKSVPPKPVSPSGQMQVDPPKPSDGEEVNPFSELAEAFTKSMS